MFSRQVVCFILLILITFSYCANNDGFIVVSSTTPSPEVGVQNVEIQELRNTILTINKRLEKFETQVRKTQKQLDELTSSPKNNLSSNGNLSRNCQEVLETGHTTSGIYKIKPNFANEEISVLCDMKRRNGGWTYMLNRYDGTQDFYLDWSSYRNGFGNISGEFWLGLENIHLLTGYELNQLLIELVDFEGKEVFAHYSLFTIGSEKEGYRLKYLQGYNGDAGDALSHHLGMKFTTKDRDQDVYKAINCANASNAGWWYRGCKLGHPTGVYLGEHFDEKDKWKGIFWDTFRKIHDQSYSLKEVRMMVKPYRPGLPMNANPAF